MIEGSYNATGAKRLMEEGGSARRAVAQKLVESLGGTLEAFYFAFGDVDLYAIVDAPDNVSAVAASMAVNAGGAVTCKTTVLITADEMDEAAKRKATYGPPGS